MVLARGGDPNQMVGNVGETALIAAADRGHQEVVGLLLEQPGISVNATATNEWTALHYAAAQGHLEVVVLLLEKPGISVNEATFDGWTALHFSARDGHEEMLALLLEHPEIDARATTDNGDTILHSACAGYSGPDMLRRLLAHPDTDPNVKNLYESTPIMYVLERNRHIDIQRVCLQALVESDKVVLDVKDEQGRSLEDLAR